MEKSRSACNRCLRTMGEQSPPAAPPTPVDEEVTRKEEEPRAGL